MQNKSYPLTLPFVTLLATSLHHGVPPGRREKCDTPLAKVFRETGGSGWQLAKALSCHPTKARWILNGQQMPTLIEALRINQIWGVPMAAWAGTKLGQAEWNHEGFNWEGYMRAHAKAFERWKEKNPEKYRASIENAPSSSKTNVARRVRKHKHLSKELR